MHYIYITFKTPNRLTDFIFCTKKQRLCIVYRSSHQEKKKGPLNFIFIFKYTLSLSLKIFVLNFYKTNWKHKVIHLDRKLNLKICDKRP